jgi:hypothetical protein
MLVQDQMTGYISEVPDHLYGYEGYYGEYPDQIGESQMLYDGLGNPVGLFPAIAALAAKALPMVGNIASKIPGVGNILNKIPGVGQILGAGGAPGLPGMPPLPIPIPRPGFPSPYRTPAPLGWIRPPLPYTGLGPRRLYMRCAVWPGPRGLVPASAATAPPPALPAPGTPAAAAQAAAAAAGAGRHRRHRRRR